MSICRWSGGSDVYVYDSAGGFDIHVATYRLAFDPEYPRPSRRADHPGSAEEWDAAERKAWDHVSQVPIDHSQAGASFTEPTAAACLNRLLELRGEGFAVPESAIDHLASQVVA